MGLKHVEERLRRLLRKNPPPDDYDGFISQGLGLDPAQFDYDVVKALESIAAEVWRDYVPERP